MSAKTPALTDYDQLWEVGFFINDSIACVIVPVEDVRVMSDTEVGEQVRKLSLEAVRYAASIMLEEWYGYSKDAKQMERVINFFSQFASVGIPEVAQILESAQQQIEQNQQQPTRKKQKLLLTPEDYEFFSGRSFVEDYVQRPTLREWAKELRQCAYCGKFEADTKDHIIPKSMGGTNEPENLIDCCRSCNSKKGARTPEQAGMPILYDDR